MAGSELWWLSFSDGDKPSGQQWLGCTLIEGETFLSAHLTASMAGANPGGECIGMSFPTELAERVPARLRGRLLSREETEEVDRLLGGDGELQLFTVGDLNLSGSEEAADG